MKHFLCFLLLAFKAYSSTQVFEGLAKSEAHLAYLERHSLDYEGTALVRSVIEYFDPDGKLIGSLSSRFTPGQFAPEFVLHDYRQGRSHGLHWVDHRAEAFSQEKRGVRVNRKILRISDVETLVSAPGLIYFVAENLDKIPLKGHLNFKYIIPGRSQAYDFTIKSVAHGVGVAEFEIEMKFWVMRIFGPKTRLIFDTKRRRILFYEGQSILRDPEGNMMSVDIEYKYKGG